MGENTSGLNEQELQEAVVANGQEMTPPPIQKAGFEPAFAVGVLHRQVLRAAPRAVFAVTAIRLQPLPPLRLRRCALRLPQGIGARPIPAARCLALLQDRQTGLRRIGQASTSR